MYQANTNTPTNLIYVNSRLLPQKNLYKLANPMMCDAGKQFLVSLTEFAFTHTIPNVKDAVITFDRATVRIPDGHYNAVNFRDKLNFLLYGTGITCVFDFRNLKYSFVSTTPLSIVACTCGRIIGLGTDDRNEFVLPQTSTIPLHTVHMPNQVNFIASSMINLFVGDFNIQSYNTAGVNTRVLARIPVLVPYGGSSVHRPMEVTKLLLQRKLLNQLSIRITDEYGNDVPIHYNMQLTVQQVVPQPEQEADINSIPWFYKTVLKLPYGDDTFTDESELATN